MDRRLEFPFPLGLFEESQNSDENERRLLALGSSAVHRPTLLGSLNSFSQNLSHDLSQLTGQTYPPFTSTRIPVFSGLSALQAVGNQPGLTQPVLPAADETTEDRDRLFPYILHGLLDDIEKAGQTSVISWSPDGKAFRIHNEDVFQERILRLYFGQDSVDDFRATLFSWGFNGDEDGSYQHPCFVKDRPEFRLFMKRKEAAREQVPAPKNLQVPDVSEARTGSHTGNLQCSSTDCTHVALACSKASKTNELEASSCSTVPTKGPGNFLTRLRCVLQKAEDEGLQHIVAWQPHGKTFKVYDRQAFVERLLPHCMDSRQYGALQRVLRRWGFVRIKQGHDEGAHYHILFVRDDLSLCQDLTPRQMRDGMAEVVEKIDFFGVRRNKDTKKRVETAVSSAGSRRRPPEGKSSIDKGDPKRARLRKIEIKTEVLPLPPSGSVFMVSEVHDLTDLSDLLFPWKLHQMLDDAEKDSGVEEKIVSWQPDSVSFTIRDKNLFVSRQLPKYFEEKTWSDFMNKLSNWGFVCFTSGPQKGAFIHRLLVRGKRSLCRQMRYHGKTVSDMFKIQGAFLVRLHETLGVLQDEGKESVASWDLDGKSFTVHEPNVFINDIFSAYFESLTFSAFEQKLRSWGFLRTPMYYSEGKVTYSHPGFTRDKTSTIIRATGQMKADSIRVEHSFLVRLRVILDDAQRYGHQTVVSWAAHGKAFIVHDRPYFSNNIMPLYFKAKFTSFRQSLRNHGFAQMGGNGWDEGAYYHKLFVRYDPTLCQGVSLHQMKEAMPEWIPASEEPNFYASGEGKERSQALALVKGTTDSADPLNTEDVASYRLMMTTEDCRDLNGDSKSSAEKTLSSMNSFSGSSSTPMDSSSPVTCLEYLYKSAGHRSSGPSLK